MDNTIRYIKKDELPKLLRFNKRNYRPGHILTNKTYLDWQFGTYPSSKRHYTILGMFSGKGELFGVFGFTPMYFRYFGKKAQCTSLANLMVDERLRNLGLGYALLREAESLNPITLDHGLNDDAMKLFLGRGWSGGMLSRYGFVFESSSVNRIIGKKGARIKNSPQRAYDEDGFLLVPLDRYDARFEPFFKKMNKKYPITADRSRSYLNWRYFNHPLIDYRIFVAVKNNAIHSFVVVRMDGPKDFRVGRIIDFISTDAAELFSLGKALEFCREQKAICADYYFSGTAHTNSLKSLGFADCARGAYKLLPTRLNPVVPGKTFINFVVRTDGATQYKKAKNIKYWYTTKGGGDQDRAY